MQDYLIIGAGSTVKHYKDKIEELWLSNPYTMFNIGINNVFDLFGDILSYSFWTNTKRFGKYYKPTKNTHLVVTRNIFSRYALSDIREIYDYEIIEDDINKWRTAGCRAIQWAHDQGADNIYVVGMDGYTLKYKGDQHCYGSGNTDSDNMKIEHEKDGIVYGHLRRMKSEGVNFKILTPTVFTEFYEGSLL